MSTKKNFIYNISYQILVIIIPLITTPYISRVIGANGIGIQSYTLSIANYFVLFAMLGINNHGNRSVAMVREDRNKLSITFFSIYYIQAIISSIMLMLYIVYFVFFAKEYKIFFMIQMLYILGAFMDINWLFFGLEQFRLTVIRNSIIKIVSLIGIFIFVKDSSDIYIYSLILSLSTFISQVILWRFVNRYITFTKVGWRDIKQHIKPIFVLFIPVISISIYKIMAKIMIGAMSDVTEVGFYENSEKIITIPLGVIMALATVMLPKMSNLYASGNGRKSEKYIMISMQFVVFIALGAMFGLIGISGVLIPVFLGDNFNKCIDIVSLLSISIIFTAWANVIRTQFLIPNKLDKIYINSTILGAIINLVINILLINKFGAIGAAIGTIFAEASVAIYQTLKVRKALNINGYLRKTIFYIIPGLIMCVVIKYIGVKLDQSLLTAFIQVFVGSIIYCGIGLIYMIISKSELIVNILNKYKSTIID